MVRDISADIVDENSYLDILNEHPVYFFGNGAAKCREKITHPNAHFIDDIHPLAKMMFPPILGKRHSFLLSVILHINELKN